MVVFFFKINKKPSILKLMMTKQVRYKNWSIMGGGGFQNPEEVRLHISVWSKYQKWQIGEFKVSLQNQNFLYKLLSTQNANTRCLSNNTDLEFTSLSPIQHKQSVTPRGFVREKNHNNRPIAQLADCWGVFFLQNPQKSSLNVDLFLLYLECRKFCWVEKTPP